MRHPTLEAIRSLWLWSYPLVLGGSTRRSVSRLLASFLFATLELIVVVRPHMWEGVKVPKKWNLEIFLSVSGVTKVTTSYR